MGWLFLAGAIGTEVAATLALRTVATGWRPGPGAVVVLGYLASFTLLALALRTVPVSTAYAVWSGAGTAGVTLLAALLYGERITPAVGAGIALIVAGVVTVNAAGAGHG